MTIRNLSPQQMFISLVKGHRAKAFFKKYLDSLGNCIFALPVLTAE